MQRIILTISFLLSLASLNAQNSLSIKGMDFRYKVIQDSLLIDLAGPTDGWILVGFNDKNSVDLCDMKIFHVVNGEAEAQDLKNTGGGRNIAQDIKLGGKNDIRILKAEEAVSQTYVSFKIPIKSMDPNDFQINLDQPMWLILAYSQEDDFEHHSLMRHHMPYIFLSE